MYILGIKVDNVSIDECLEHVAEFLRGAKQRYIVTPNPEIILTAQEDGGLKNILNQADLSIPDGFGLILASKYMGQPLRQRVAGTDLFYKICTSSWINNYRVFFLGGRNGVAQKAVENLKAVNPGLKILTDEDIKKAIEKINDFGTDIVFVGLGAPKQEKWIGANMNKLPAVRVFVAVGGAFDFISGQVFRAPDLVKKLGLEWLWRLIIQPWRMGRIYSAVIKFPWLVIRSRTS